MPWGSLGGDGSGWDPCAKTSDQRVEGGRGPPGAPSKTAKAWAVGRSPAVFFG